MHEGSQKGDCPMGAIQVMLGKHLIFDRCFQWYQDN